MKRYFYVTVGIGFDDYPNQVIKQVAIMEGNRIRKTVVGTLTLIAILDRGVNWDKTVGKMINIISAPLNAADKQTIIDYLAQSYGKKGLNFWLQTYGLDILYFDGDVIFLFPTTSGQYLSLHRRYPQVLVPIWLDFLSIGMSKTEKHGSASMPGLPQRHITSSSFCSFRIGIPHPIGVS